MEIDGGYNNAVANPYTANAGATPNLSIGAIAWSLGVDQGGATAAAAGDKNTGVYADDVISWQRSWRSERFSPEGVRGCLSGEALAI